MDRLIEMSLEALRELGQRTDAERDELFSVDLLSKDVRRRLAVRHPMLDAGYFVETQNAGDFYNVCYDHVIARKSGLYIVGKYRIGKTKALVNAIARLQKDFPFMAFLSIDAQRKPNQPKAHFCKQVLEGWNYPLHRSQSPERVLERYLMTRAARVSGRVCVLFIDEAQLLTVTHFRYLLEIWNTLRTHGFILLTILVGQLSLDSLCNLTTELDHGAVVARFFVKRHLMGGLVSEKQLAAYMQAYDEKLVYPVGSTWTYSRYFLGEAFDAGWRLKASATVLWQLLKKHLQPNLRRDGVGLAIVTETIQSFLLDAMSEDDEDFAATPERWRDALSSAMDSLHEPEQEPEEESATPDKA